MSELIRSIGGLVQKSFMICEANGVVERHSVVCQFEHLQQAQLLHRLLVECCKPQPPEPTEQQINSACLSYDHSFWMMTAEGQESLRWEARQWLRAWRKEGE